MTANGNTVSLWGDENVLKSGLMGLLNSVNILINFDLNCIFYIF